MVSPDDSIEIQGGDIIHDDCQQPRGLSRDERVLLYRYCWYHAVAKCVACGQSFRQEELGADVFRRLSYLCPRCRSDLTESLRGHLYSCPLVLPILRQRVQDARDAARRLIKQRIEDAADVPVSEAEAAIAALRATIRETGARRSAG
jgi:transposase-like protein